jgi:hypothetical protein
MRSGYEEEASNKWVTKVLLMLILITLMTICSRQTVAKGQDINRKPNTVYVALQATDYGIGVRYDRMFNGVGVYTSLSHGNYWLDPSHDTYIKDHYKYTIGVICSLPNQPLDNTYTFDVVTGLNYHWWGTVYLDGMQLDPRVWNPWSFELGVNCKFNRFALGVRTDIMRWEPCIDLGIKF